MTTTRKACCHPESDHPDHSKHINRINRLAGQLDGVRKMIEERKYCPDILVQTRAVRAAIRSLEASILEAHLENCVKDAFQAEDSRKAEEKVNELIEIYLRQE